MPSGHAVRPGDIITISNGKTVEVNNTDAEGRLILADAIAYAAGQGADRIIDLATLTGAIIVALGSTYAGLFSNDDALCAQLAEASAVHGRARLAHAAPPRLQGADARQGRRPRERVGAAQGIVRLRRLVPRGVRRTASRGRTSTSPASPGTRTTATTSARARAAGACACSSSSRAGSREKASIQFHRKVSQR